MPVDRQAYRCTVHPQEIGNLPVNEETNEVRPGLRGSASGVLQHETHLISRHGNPMREMNPSIIQEPLLFGFRLKMRQY